MASQVPEQGRIGNGRRSDAYIEARLRSDPSRQHHRPAISAAHPPCATIRAPLPNCVLLVWAMLLVLGVSMQAARATATDGPVAGGQKLASSYGNATAAFLLSSAGVPGPAQEPVSGVGHRWHMEQVTAVLGVAPDIPTGRLQPAQCPLTTTEVASGRVLATPNAHRPTMNDMASCAKAREWTGTMQEISTLAGVSRTLQGLIPIHAQL
ncbi:hypothetical protein Vafri_13700 [Volvox africanus]|uniref:Uncharacterized protein n=1 Tax=Volvox africanus TaxID=51714 RepID=A0A8J4BD49_9CHLO|nr:hypothetical protein Vafri_13700 [Volvox africanus]